MNEMELNTNRDNQIKCIKIRDMIRSRLPLTIDQYVDLIDDTIINNLIRLTPEQSNIGYVNDLIYYIFRYNDYNTNNKSILSKIEFNYKNNIKSLITNINKFKEIVVICKNHNEFIKLVNYIVIESEENPIYNRKQDKPNFGHII
jgi:hypothetical protein